MKIPRWLPLVALALAAWYAYGCEQRRHGALEQKIKVAEAERDSLAKVYRRDTVTLTRVRRITDTVEIAAPIRKLIEDERVACNAVIGTCEQEKANLAKLLRLEKEKRPSRFGCAAGVAATPKGAGLGAACGIRFP